MKEKEIFDYKKAGKIAREVREFARGFICRYMKLVDIAEKIEGKIFELGGKPAFPVNLSLNDVAAHYTPNYDDETKADGLLKIDLGVEIGGAIADTAFSLDLSEKKEFAKLISASENALNSALKILKKNIEINKIGKEIHREITFAGFSPVKNLSGHELGNYLVHAGITIPNYDNNNFHKLEDGGYAIEPFATSGVGIVYDGQPSEIYKFEKRAGVRDILARKIMDFIEEEYKTLPFCSRWIVKKFGTRALIALNFLEKAGIIYRYSQLVEKSHSPVSQTEHTFIIHDGKVEITTI